MAAKHQVKRKSTARELAQRWGVSPSTVRRHIAQPREEYLANSVSRSKPWLALGISRATWYRRGKPKPPAANQAGVAVENGI